MSQNFSFRQAAVIGAGTMGRGIVMCLANAGLDVQWLDSNPQMLNQALGAVADTYAHNVRQGRIGEEEAAARRARITPVQHLAAMREADLVIEAVYENLELKQSIFRELDAALKPSAVLASNTSYLDIDAIAAVTARPGQVLGLHFFSPAHIMRLLEIVRGAQTAPAVLEAALALGERMGKVSVVAGNCHGFIGNRMLEPYATEARLMLLEGALPYQVDRALQTFGFAMGPFRMYDVVGIDLEWRARELAGSARTSRPCRWTTVFARWAASARRAVPATTATRQAAARRSTIPKWMPWCSGLPRRWVTRGAISPTRKSSSVACWRWSTRGRRSSTNVSPPVAPTSTLST